MKCNIFCADVVEGRVGSSARRTSVTFGFPVGYGYCSVEAREMLKQVQHDALVVQHDVLVVRDDAFITIKLCTG